MKLSEKELERFEKQMILPNIGHAGMQLIKDATVMVIGLGGGGCAASLQLALSNFGKIILCDFDTVGYSNLGRQFLHRESTIGMKKVESAKRAIQRINPDIIVETEDEKISLSVLEKIKKNNQNLFIFVSVDRFYAHTMINEFCIANGIPAVHIAQFLYKGFAYIYDPKRSKVCLNCCLKSNFRKEIDKDYYDNNDVDIPYLAPAISIVCGYAVVELIKMRLSFEKKSMANTFMIYRALDHSDMFEERQKNKPIFEEVQILPEKTCDLCQKCVERTEYRPNLSEKLYKGTLPSFRDNVYDIISDPCRSKDIKFKYVTMWMSRECNSNCLHCYQDGSPSGSGWSLDKADKVTDIFLNDGYIVQPIINEWLPKYWPFLSILNKCGSTEITTNGIILVSHHEEFIPLLHQYGIKKIKVTLFPEEYHKHYTGKNYEHTIQAIQIAKDNGFFTTQNFVVMKDTLSLLPGYCEDALKRGIDEIQFMNFFCTDHQQPLFSQVLSGNDLKQFWELRHQIDSDPKFSGMHFDQQASFGPKPYGDNVFKRASLSNKLCLAGEWEQGIFLYTDPEDGIYPCPMLSDHQFRIGEIIENKGYYSYYLKKEPMEHYLKNFDRSVCNGYLHSLHSSIKARSK